MFQVGLLLFLLVNFVTGYSDYDEDQKFDVTKCDKIKFYTRRLKREHISHSHYVILENCLYYNLSEKWDQVTNLTDSLYEFAPSNKVDIEMNGLILESFYKTYYGHSAMSTWINMTWIDRRLQWNTHEWKMDTMNIKLATDIWVPPTKLSDDESINTMAGEKSTSVQNIRVDYRGHVTAKMNIKSNPDCQDDNRFYVLSMTTCCSSLEFVQLDKNVRYRIINSTGTVPKHETIWWTISDFNLHWSSSGQSTNVDEKTLKICLKAVIKEYGSSEQVKLFLPMVTSVMLVIVAPFFGTMPKQIYAKLSTILFQFLCFRNFSDSHWFTFEHTFRTEVKTKTCFFYQLTICTTMVSLFVTLVLNMQMRKVRKLPLNRKAKNFGDFMQNFTFWSNLAKNELCTEENHDWKRFLIATNDAASVILIVIYVLILLANVL